MLLHRSHGNAISAAFNPASLFAGGFAGFWFDPSDLSTLFQVSDGTGAVTADNDPVGYIADKSGNSHEATQSTANDRALYKTSGGLHWFDFDGSGDKYSLLTALDTFRNIGNVTAIAGVRRLLNTTFADVFAISTGAALGQSRLAMLTNGSEQFQLGGRVLDGNTFLSVTGSSIASIDCVLTGQFNTASSDLIGRLNGVQNINDTTWHTDTNTSDTSSLAVTFGGRGDGIETWIGRIYGLIVVVKELNAQEILNAEQWMATKCGITL